MERQEIINSIDNIENIPVLNKTKQIITDLLSDENSYAQKLCLTIQSDPVLCAYILRIANSAMYKHSNKETSDLLKAINLLGINLTINIAIALSFKKSLVGSALSDDVFENKFWKKSILSGCAAFELKQRALDIDCGDLYTASLLQDIGSYIMALIIGSDYIDLYKSSINHRDLVENERNHYHIDHAEVGAKLLERWHLSKTVVEAVRYSHNAYDKMPVKCLDINYFVCFSGIMADDWITDNNSVSIKEIMHPLPFPDDVMNDFSIKTLEAVPEASNAFGIKLLTASEIENLKEYFS